MCFFSGSHRQHRKLEEYFTWVVVGSTVVNGLIYRLTIDYLRYGKYISHDITRTRSVETDPENNRGE